jgi:hypothetical protein
MPGLALSALERHALGCCVELLVDACVCLNWLEPVREADLASELLRAFM